MSEEVILSVKNLSVTFDTEEGIVEAVKEVNFDVYQGKTLCIVGESGCGKSVSAYAIMGLIPMPPGKIESGEILLRNEDLLKKSHKEFHRHCGKDIAMIFQEPMTALNPVLKIGHQIEEMLKIHFSMSKEERHDRVIELLKKVGIASPEEKYHSYPHQMSGGQRQRVVIAIALACNPALLIADEPTTALDVTIQAQILDLLTTLKESQNMSLMLITHDLAVVAEIADEVVVMYAGSVVESGTVETIFNSPQHPYTKALLNTLPIIGENKKLEAISGTVPRLIGLGEGCRFANRCPLVQDVCRTITPTLDFYTETNGTETHRVRCHLANTKKASTKNHGTKKADIKKTGTTNG